jgi:replicative superfamily II helicase
MRTCIREVKKKIYSRMIKTQKTSTSIHIVLQISKLIFRFCAYFVLYTVYSYLYDNSREVRKRILNELVKLERHPLMSVLFSLITDPEKVDVLASVHTLSHGQTTL